MSEKDAKGTGHKGKGWRWTPVFLPWVAVAALSVGVIVIAYYCFLGDYTYTVKLPSGTPFEGDNVTIFLIAVPVIRSIKIICATLLFCGVIRAVRTAFLKSAEIAAAERDSKDDYIDSAIARLVVGSMRELGGGTGGPSADPVNTDE